MKDEELRSELASKIVLPALKKIISEFGVEHQEKKSKVYFKHHRTMIESSKQFGSIYSYLLKAVYLILLEDFSINESAINNAVGFNNAVKTELEID